MRASFIAGVAALIGLAVVAGCDDSSASCADTCTRLAGCGNAGAWERMGCDAGRCVISMDECYPCLEQAPCDGIVAETACPSSCQDLWRP